MTLLIQFPKGKHNFASYYCRLVLSIFRLYINKIYGQEIMQSVPYSPGIFFLNIMFVRVCVAVCSHSLFSSHTVFIPKVWIFSNLFFMSHCWWKFRLFPLEVLIILLLWIFWNTSFKIQIYIFLLSIYLEVELLDHKEWVSNCWTIRNE